MGLEMLGLTAHAREDTKEDLGLLDSRGGCNSLGTLRQQESCPPKRMQLLGKLRQQGVGDGEELRGLGDQNERG